MQMGESVKIVSIEVENVKRVRLARLDCSGKSLVAGLLAQFHGARIVPGSIKPV